MAAWAPAADMLFRFVDMVHMHLSNVLDQRFRFSLTWRRLILSQVTMAPMNTRRERRMASEEDERRVRE